MTYEQLFLYIASIQPALPKCALPVLIHLIAKCINDGSNVVSVSDRTLAHEVGISRQAVCEAASALKHIIGVDVAARVVRKWVLPREWFYEQRTLFATKAAVENTSNWPGNQASSGKVTRPAWRSDQASTGIATRPDLVQLPGQWPSNQARLVQLPGQAGTATRPDHTHNQQLTDHNEVRSDQSVDVFTRNNTDRFDQIIGAELLKIQQVEDARVLSEHLRAYMHDLGPTNRDEEDLGEVVLARCLACAPLGELTSLLRTLRVKGTAAGKSYAWFVAVFAHRLCGIPSKQLRAGLAQHYKRKQVQRETEAQFIPQLLNQTFANVRSMR